MKNDALKDKGISRSNCEYIGFYNAIQTYM